VSRKREAELREEVLADLARAERSFVEALRPDGPNVFSWHGADFWVDRSRGLIVPALGLRAAAGATTLDEADADQSDLLDVYAGDAQLEDAGTLLRMWAALLSGRPPDTIWEPAGAKMLNLAIAQPAVNPPFGPLLWLALADDLGPHEDWSPNFLAVIEPLVIGLRDVPRPPLATVRAAQVAFVERLFPGSTDAATTSLADDVWTRRCHELLEANQALVDRCFFYPLVARGV
jgi:hypothetical protein